MILMLHLLAALGSLAYTTYLFMRPKQNRFAAAYVFVTATLISGTYLVISTKSGLLEACTTGLIYLSLVTIGLATAHKKIAQSSKIN